MDNTAFVAGAILLLAIAIVFVTFMPQKAAPGIVEKDASGAYMVSIRDYSFSPQNVNISIGETVKWTNRDSVMHSLTSDTAGMFASAPLGSGDNFTYSFDVSGVYLYHCGVHPQMVGKITVN